MWNHRESGKVQENISFFNNLNYYFKISVVKLLLVYISDSLKFWLWSFYFLFYFLISYFRRIESLICKLKLNTLELNHLYFHFYLKFFNNLKKKCFIIIFYHFLFEYKNTIVNFKFHRIFKSISRRIKYVHIDIIHTIIHIYIINCIHMSIHKFRFNVSYNFFKSFLFRSETAII